MLNPIDIAKDILQVAYYIHKTVKQIKTFKEHAEELDHRLQIMQPSLQVLSDITDQRQQVFKDEEEDRQISLFAQALGDMHVCVDEIKAFVDDLQTMTTRRKLTEKNTIKNKVSKLNRQLDVLERSIQFGILVEMKRDVESGKKEKTMETFIYHVKKSAQSTDADDASEEELSSTKSSKTRPLPTLSADELDVGEELGEGGFGTVYLAKYRHAEKVAVKIFDVGNTSQILREASKMRKAIFSSYIVRLIGIIDEQSIQAIVMAYYEYGNMKSFLPYLHRDGWARRMRMLCDISCGIHHLHSLDPPLIHRDIKLSNIFVDHGFNAKIGDLGLSTGGSSSVTTKRLSRNVLIGTYSHIPPEVWAGIATEPKPPLDIYELGISMYELASSDTPWPSNVGFEVVRGLVTDGKRPTLQNVKSDTPPEIVEVMQRCWHGNPSQRPNSKEIVRLLSELFECQYQSKLLQADKTIRENIEKGLVESNTGTFADAAAESTTNTTNGDEAVDGGERHIALHDITPNTDDVKDLAFNKDEVLIVDKKKNTDGVVEFPGDAIHLKTKITSSEFGDLWTGTINDEQMCTVRTYRARDCISENDFLNQANVMKLLNHKNIVRLLGVSKVAPYILLFGTANCRLRDYLTVGKGKTDSLRTLVEISNQIASAMDALEKLSIVHAHLSSRSFLMYDDNVPKLWNFSRAKLLDTVDGSHCIGKAGDRFSLLIKWTAPEVLPEIIPETRNVAFSIKTDVWSFGIVLWEILNPGETPYPGLSNDEAWMRVKSGYRMPQPTGCPDEIYQLMRDTWHEDPQRRPTFHYIHTSLSDFVALKRMRPHFYSTRV